MGTKARTDQSAATRVPARKRAAAARVRSRTGSTPAKTGAGSATTAKGASPAVEDISRRALLRQARERLDRISEVRDAAHLSETGLGQREIAQVLHTTQPRVHRMLKAATWLNRDKESPEEVILRATVDQTDRSDLVKRLSTMTYTFKKHAPAPFEGAVSGSWDQVTAAVVADLLSRTEYEQIRDAVQPPA